MHTQERARIRSQSQLEMLTLTLAVRFPNQFSTIHIVGSGQKKNYLLDFKDRKHGHNTNQQLQNVKKFSTKSILASADNNV